MSSYLMDEHTVTHEASVNANICLWMRLIAC